MFAGSDRTTTGMMTVRCVKFDFTDVEFVFEFGILIVFDCVNDVLRQLEAVTVDDANAAFYERIEHPDGCACWQNVNVFGLCLAVFVLAVRDITCAVFLINHNLACADFIDVVIVAVRIDSVNTGDFRAADSRGEMVTVTTASVTFRT